MRSLSKSGVLTLLLLAASLQAQSPRASWPIADAPVELRDSIARADLIVVEMQSQLLRELSRALERGGPAGAVKSCHVDVTGIAARVGRQAAPNCGGLAGAGRVTTLRDRGGGRTPRFGGVSITAPVA